MHRKQREETGAPLLFAELGLFFLVYFLKYFKAMENNFDQNGLSVEKSLEIISEAINNSRQDFQRRGGTAMLIWGTTVILVSGIVLLGLTLSDNNHLWNLAWFLIPFIGWPLNQLVFKRIESKGKGENFVSRSVGIVWGIFGILAIAVGIMAFFIPIPTNGVIILLLGMAGYLRNSGTALRLLPEHTHSADHGHRSADDPGHPRPDIQPSNQ